MRELTLPVLLTLLSFPNGGLTNMYHYKYILTVQHTVSKIVLAMHLSTGLHVVSVASVVPPHVRLPSSCLGQHMPTLCTPVATRRGPEPPPGSWKAHRVQPVYSQGLLRTMGQTKSPMHKDMHKRDCVCLPLCVCHVRVHVHYKLFIHSADKHTLKLTSLKFLNCVSLL